MATTTAWIPNQSNPQVISGIATIDAGESETLAIPCGGRSVVRIGLPTITSGNLTFSAQAYPGATFRTLKDLAGNTVTHPSTSGAEVFDVPELSGVYAFKIMTGATQVAARAIEVQCVGPYPSTSGNNSVTLDPNATVVPVTATSGGATPYSYISVGTNDDATVVKASAGQVYAVMATNVNAAVRYLKIYNKATAPTTSDTPLLRLAIPGNAAGAGFVLPAALGMAFSAGISFRLVTGVADNNGTDVAADEIIVNIGYK